MKLSIGIVGLPNVGKSTLFKALTKQEVHIANYPFVTINPNVGVVPVPDERLAKLAAISHSKKVIPAVVEFYDIAGLVKGSNKGEGLGNQFLAHIRETQAIVTVIRLFGNSDIVHVESTVDPVRDLEIVNTELALKDLESLEKRRGKTEGEARSGKKEAVQELAALNTIAEHLKKGILLCSSPELTGLIRTNGGIRDLNLLTAKKQLYLLNGKPEDVKPELIQKIKDLGADYLVADLGSDTADVSALIRKSYEILDLITFFTTTGGEEAHAWTIERGTKAPQAAGVVHTDFEKNFIRAEVVNWQKLLEAAHLAGSTHSTSSGQAGSPQAGSGQGTWAAARQKGFLRLEGKEYIVQDGDVVVIRHG